MKTFSNFALIILGKRFPKFIIFWIQFSEIDLNIIFIFIFLHLYFRIFQILFSKKLTFSKTFFEKSNISER
jgi:hypothetical protein